MFLRSLVVAILTISTSAGCAGSERPAMEPVGGAERVATVQSDHALPSSSLSDWRTYGMRLVSATVLGEDALPVEPAFEAVGEGSIGRTVDLKIGDVHWRADDAWVRPSTFRRS